MKNKGITLVAIIIMCFLSASCVTRKKLTYIQSISNKDSRILNPTDDLRTYTPTEYEILPNDVLYISVVTPDPQWSTLFNTVPVGAGGAMTEQSAALLGYPVDSYGNISLPFIGKLKVSGKTLSKIKSSVDSTLKKYVNDASITVRMVNNYISILGEVTVPGRYPITREAISVFEAIAMAGDLRDFSDRQKVKIIRQTSNGPSVKEFSLSDNNILSSKYYFIMPNDIIYVQPRKGRGFNTNSSIISLIFNSITTFLVIYSYITVNSSK